MGPTKRKQIDPLERAIEEVLNPGSFVSYNVAWSFVNDVQDLANDIDDQVPDVEFPSGVLPWTKLAQRGVEVKVVKHRNWYIHLEDIEAQIDEQTRVVAISHVSMFTGQRMDLPELSKLVHASNAILLVDATHAAGVVEVPAVYADIVVTSCYKWLMGVHGTAVFYWNRERLPDLQPPFIGWHSAAKKAGWLNPTEYTLYNNANRFIPGNPGFISIYFSITRWIVYWLSAWKRSRPMPCL